MDKQIRVTIAITEEALEAQGLLETYNYVEQRFYLALLERMKDLMKKREEVNKYFKIPKRKKKKRRL